VDRLGGRAAGDTAPRLKGINVDAESFKESAVEKARTEKEQAEARKSVQHALSEERDAMASGRNQDAIMLEVHRLKNSADPRERFRGEMLEAAQDEIDRRHIAGDVGGARVARSMLVEEMRHDRERFERERERDDARNVIEATRAIERMRASPDPAVREAGEQAAKQLGESNLKQQNGEVTEARMDREKLVQALREQSPERSQREGREVSEALPDGSPAPEATDAPKVTPKPESPPKTQPKADGPSRNDGPELDHA